MRDVLTLFSPTRLLTDQIEKILVPHRAAVIPLGNVGVGRIRQIHLHHNVHDLPSFDRSHFFAAPLSVESLPSSCSLGAERAAVIPETKF